MPSFDITCEPDMQEIRNAVDQAQREVSTRFDLKGTQSKIEFTDTGGIEISADGDYYVETITDILISKLIRRGVDPRYFERPDVEVAPGGRAKRMMAIKKGLPAEEAKKIVKFIKELPVKVQPAIQGDHVRVSGKKRDDLQEVIAALKRADFDRPLSYGNFRD